jgi:hypothetical protein
MIREREREIGKCVLATVHMRKERKKRTDSIEHVTDERERSNNKIK